MRQLEIQGRILTDKDVFVIAEIGSNHLGDRDLCERMIVKAAECGVDAVKLQKRDRSMLTNTERNRPYENENSFGRTYGEHRDHLDYFGGLTDVQLFRAFARFKYVAERCGLVFFATPFTLKDVIFLHRLGVKLWKIASCDATNLPMIAMVAKYGDPLIISTGGSAWADIDRIVKLVDPINPNFALLHCVSTYPNTDENVNISAVARMMERYPEKIIGFSSHHPKIGPSIGAVWSGGNILEHHFTFNRANKGTDNSFSLEPGKLQDLCFGVKKIDMQRGTGEKTVISEEKNGFITKMGKGIYLSRPKMAGERIEEADICIKSPAGGFRPGEVGKVIGGVLINDCSTGVAIKEGMIR